MAEAFPAVEFYGRGTTLGRLYLPGRASGPVPLVLVFGELSAPDRRSDRYVDRLNAFSITALGLGASNPDDLPLSQPPTAEAVLARAVEELGSDVRFDLERVDVIGFGTGARAALDAAFDASDRHAASGALVLLYPGCTATSEALQDRSSPHARRTAPSLLVHGGDDAANLSANCADLAEEMVKRAPMRWIEYRGAGYAWNRLSYDGDNLAIVPPPDRPGRVGSAAWPALAGLSAEEVASFFLRAVPCSR
jgi:dienelactone hydrolase